MSKVKKDDYVRVRIGTDAKKKLALEAELQHRSMSELVRMALEDLFKKGV